MTNWTQAEKPIAPWDSPGLPPRRMSERCAHHTHCAYRDDDPNRCPICHRLTALGCNHLSQAVKVAQNRTTQPAITNAQLVKTAKTCLCPTCGETFSVVAAFDKHRQGSHADDTRHCVDPASVGLVDAGRSYSCWALPGQDPRFDADGDTSA
jgi:hypothetical protein